MKTFIFSPAVLLLILFLTSCSKKEAEENSSLKTKIVDLTKENQTLKNQLKTETDKFSNKTIELTATNQALSGNVRDLQTKCEKWDSDAAVSKTKIDSLELEKSKLALQVEGLKLDNAKMSGKLEQTNTAMVHAQETSQKTHYANAVLDLFGKTEKGLNSPKMLADSVFTEAKTENEKMALNYSEHKDSAIYKNIAEIIRLATELNRHDSIDLLIEKMLASLKESATVKNTEIEGALRRRATRYQEEIEDCTKNILALRKKIEATKKLVDEIVKTAK